MSTGFVFKTKTKKACKKPKQNPGRGNFKACIGGWEVDLKWSNELETSASHVTASATASGPQEKLEEREFRGNLQGSFHPGPLAR